MMTDKQRELAEQNHNLIYDFMRKRNLDEEEYYGIVAIGLCKAATNYNHKKGEFSTLAYKCMDNEVAGHLKYINGKTKIPSDRIFSYNILLNEDESESYIDIMLGSDFDTFKAAEKNIEYANFFKKLNDREKFIIKCFENGLNQTEIANGLNITQQAIYRNVKRIRNKWSKFKNK